MSLSLRKLKAEAQIKRIEKRIHELDVMEAQATLKPIERIDDTFLVTTHADEKNKLKAELKKYQKIIEDAAR